METFLKENLILAIFTIFFLLLSPHIASAYIDPGTGSFIIQVVLAAIFGLAFYIKLSWRRIKKFFTRYSNETNIKDSGPTRQHEQGK